MTGIDWIILAILVVSAVVSYVRGFYRELVKFFIWVAAIGIMLSYTANFASLLPIDTVESPQARLSISACILFFSTLLVGGLANWLAMKILAARRQDKFDRIGGVVFGLIRGLVGITLLVLLANLMPNIKQENWWQDSFTMPVFQRMAQSVYIRLPDEIAQHFSFT